MLISVGMCSDMLSMLNKIMNIVPAAMLDAVIDRSIVFVCDFSVDFLVL